MSISRPLPPSFSPSSKSRSPRSGNTSTSTSISKPLTLPSTNTTTTTFLGSQRVEDDRRRRRSQNGDGDGEDPPSPLTERLRITSQTVDDLASQLYALSQPRSSSQSESHAQQSNQGDRDGDGDGGKANGRITGCCCESQTSQRGAIVEVGACGTRDTIGSLERDLGVCAMIGQALLERYEALSRKFEAGVEQLEEQSTLLAQSYTQCANLERANDTHLKRYSDLSRKNEGLEKRLAQMNHTQNLTSSTLLSLRTELTHLRKTTLTIASDKEMIMEYERREQDLKEQNSELTVRVGLVEAALGEAERVGKEEKGRRERLEKEGMGMEGLVGTAKQRLDFLISQIQDLNQTDAPDVQRTLETLVADTVLAHHTSTQLASILTETREQVKMLSNENDQLRTTIGVAPRTPMATEPDAECEDEQDLRNASLVARSSGTGSATSGPRRRPLSMQPSTTTHGRQYSWTPSIAASIASSGRNSMMLSKRDSMAPSFGSSIGGETLSPRTSMIQPLAPPVVLKEPGSTSEGSGRGDARTSPILTMGGSFVSPRQRNSIGLGYTINGLPKMPSTRPGVVKQGQRSFSVDRPHSQRDHSNGVHSIAEWSATEDEGSSSHNNELIRSPASPAEASRADPFRRKRMSLNPNMGYFGPRSPQLQRLQTDPLPASPIRQEKTMESPRSEAGDSPATEERRATRRQLMLLQCSKGVQTDAQSNDGLCQIRRMDSGSTNPGLDALGFENASSSRTTPQPLSSFSPQLTTVADRSETSSLNDTRSTALPQLIDHMSKLLGKVRQADVPTLTRRLRRQHLPGDVGRLSQNTMKALALEVDALRSYFKVVLDQERDKKGDMHRRADDIHDSAITRRDLTLLLRLFKDVFSVLVDLQATVNRVIIDPSSAKKLREAAQAAGDDEDAGRGRLQASKQASSGLGWIAAPLAKYFVTTAVEDSLDSNDARKSSTDRSRSQPQIAKTAPKQLASTLATTTHVNVEFAGSGMMRRATSTLPTGGHASERLPPSPADTLTRAALGKNTAAKPIPAISLGDGTMRGGPARRDDLLGIFAGAPSGTLGGGWRVVSTPTPGGHHPRLRSTTSQYFGAQRQTRSHRRQLSSAVDAVIDQPLPEHVVMEDEEPSPSLDRTSRPRALSDSSIRTTLVSQEHEAIEPGPSIPAAVQRSDIQARSMMGSIGRRFQALTGVGLAAPAAVPTVVDNAEEQEEEVAPPDQPTTTMRPPQLPRIETPPSPPPPSTAPKPISSLSSSTRPAGFLSLFAHGTYIDSSGMARSFVEEYPEGDGLSSSFGGLGSRNLINPPPRSPVG